MHSRPAAALIALTITALTACGQPAAAPAPVAPNAPTQTKALPTLVFDQREEGTTQEAVSQYFAALANQDFPAVRKLTAGALQPKSAADLPKGPRQLVKFRYHGIMQVDGKTRAVVSVTLAPHNGGANSEEFATLVKAADGWKVEAIGPEAPANY